MVLLAVAGVYVVAWIVGVGCFDVCAGCGIGFLGAACAGSTCGARGAAGADDAADAAGTGRGGYLRV